MPQLGVTVRAREPFLGHADQGNARWLERVKNSSLRSTSGQLAGVKANAEIPNQPMQRRGAHIGEQEVSGSPMKPLGQRFLNKAHHVVEGLSCRMSWVVSRLR